MHATCCSSPRIERTTRLDVAGLALWCAILYFPFAGRPSLNEQIPDEGWYATVTKEMVASGDYVVPRFLGEGFFEKPPLFFWCQSVCLRVFGHNEFAVRFPAGLFGLLAALATCLFAGRWFGRRAGLLSGGIFATTLLMCGMGRIGMTDTLFAFCLTVALSSLYNAIQPREAASGLTGGAWFLLGCASMGLAALAKGPLGIFFPVAIGALYLLFTRSLGRLPRWSVLLAGLAVLAAVTLPWYGAMIYRYGWQFIDVFLIKQHFARFSRSGSAQYHAQPFWFYFVWTPVLFAPWSLFLLAAIASTLRNFWRRGGNHGDESPNGRAPGEQQAELFLLFWAGVIVGVLSLSKGKWFHYALPAYPALAMITGRYLVARRDRPSWGFAVAAALSSGLLLLAGAALLVRQGNTVAGAVLGATIAAGGLIALVALLLRRRGGVPWSVLVAWSFAFLMIFGAGSTDREAYKPLAQEINRRARPGDQVYLFHSGPRPRSIWEFQRCPQAVTFYLQPKTLATDQFELVRRALASRDRVFCLTDERSLDDVPSLSALAPYRITSRPAYLLGHRLGTGPNESAKPANVLVVVSNQPDH